MANTYLRRTPSSTTNRKTWTFSAWIKKSGNSANQGLFDVIGNDSNNKSSIVFGTDDTLRLYSFDSGSSSLNFTTNRKFKDVNAWYHLVIAVDTTQATQSDRVKIYVNGVQETSFSTATYPSQNLDTFFNTNTAHDLGARIDVSYYFNGSMSHVHWIDGTAYQASTFGSTDATTGEWKINTNPSVTYGTNGFFILKDGNSVTDQSPNTNNFTVTGGTLTKTEDNPSNVFATFNPLWGTAGKTFLFGNTRYQYANNYQRSAITTLAASGTDKIYLEWKHGESDNSVIHLNVLNENVAKDGRFGLDTSNNASYRLNDSNNAITFVHGTGQNGVVNKNGSAVSATDLIQVSNTDTGMMAFDCATGKFWIGKNGTWDKSGNPSTGANPIYTWTDTYTVQNPVWFGFGVEGGDEVSVNFGNGYIATTAVSSAGTNASNLGIFEYDVPTGYKALCTKGLNT